MFTIRLIKKQYGEEQYEKVEKYFKSTVGGIAYVTCRLWKGEG